MKTLLLGLLLLQSIGYTVIIQVVDRETDKPLPAEVFVKDWQVRTDAKGIAYFSGVSAGRHRLAIIADDDAYPTVNWTIMVPQQDAMIIRLEKKQP